MVDNQKVVVILLLITIILAVVSVILTLGITLPEQKADFKVKGSQIGNLDEQVSVQNGQIQLTVEPPSG